MMMRLIKNELTFDPRINPFPIIGEFFEVRVCLTKLVEGTVPFSLTLSTNDSVNLNDWEECEVIESVIETDGSKFEIPSYGYCDFRIKINIPPLVKFYLRAEPIEHSQIQQLEDGSIIKYLIYGSFSHPLTNVRYRLNISNLWEDGFIHFKDDARFSGSALRPKLELVDLNGRVEVNLRALQLELLYENKEKVEPKNNQEKGPILILNQADLNREATDDIEVEFKITELSRNHEFKQFRVRISTGMDDVNDVYTSSVTVKSKSNKRTRPNSPDELTLFVPSELTHGRKPSFNLELSESPVSLARPNPNVPPEPTHGRRPYFNLGLSQFSV